MAREPYIYRTVVINGDSFTNGIWAFPRGLSGEGLTGGKAYRDLLFDAVQEIDSGYGADGWIRGGDIGGKLADAAVLPAAWNLASRPDLIFLALGQNDGVPNNFNETTFRANAQTAMDYIVDNTNVMLVVLGLPFQPGAPASGWTNANTVLQEEAEARSFLYYDSWSRALQTNGKMNNQKQQRNVITDIWTTDGSEVGVRTLDEHFWTTGDAIQIGGTNAFDIEDETGQTNPTITVDGPHHFHYTDPDAPAAGTWEQFEGSQLGDGIATKPISGFVGAASSVDSYHPDNVGYQQLFEGLWVDLKPIFTNKLALRRATTARTTETGRDTTTARDIA